MRGLLLLAIAGVLPPVALAEETPSDPVQTPAEDSGETGSNPYADLSDEAFGDVAASFEDLDQDERRWFLTEVRKRMSAKGERARIPVDDRDRFGRVREASTLVREVRMEEGDPVTSSSETERYGTGLERPTRSDRDPGSVTSRPTQEPTTLRQD